MPVIIDGSGSATFQTPLPLLQGGTGITTFQIPVPLAQGGTGSVVGALSGPNGSAFTLRNRIINGDMRIDQRNAGAAVTVTDAYTVDRWEMREDTDGACTVQQVTDAPPSFGFSTKFTTTTADASLTTTQRLFNSQQIEGFNASDFVFGTASAKTVTVSFWVKSSLTGTFAGSLQNSVRNRSYVFNYTISTASTWEYKTVAISGDTAGTWIGAANGIGLRLNFALGVGPDLMGTADSWQASGILSSTGAVSVIGTLNATWQITGVQLEEGSVATPFERRPIGFELTLCQRYFFTVPAQLFGYPSPNSGGYAAVQNYPFKVTMRAPPTATFSLTSQNNIAAINSYATTVDSHSIQVISSITTNTTWIFTGTYIAEL